MPRRLEYRHGYDFNYVPDTAVIGGALEGVTSIIKKIIGGIFGGGMTGGKKNQMQDFTKSLSDTPTSFSVGESTAYPEAASASRQNPMLGSGENWNINTNQGSPSDSPPTSGPVKLGSDSGLKINLGGSVQPFLGDWLRKH